MNNKIIYQNFEVCITFIMAILDYLHYKDPNFDIDKLSKDIFEYIERKEN